jgi:putative nucleotidyltransferase with HDIG domain
MVHAVKGWSPDIDRRFKQLLFRFLEDVQSTKAALYLLAEDGRYVLVAQYGFGRRDLLADAHDHGDPMTGKVRELRTMPWAANDPAETGDLADYLEGAGTARVLLVPLYAESRVLGFVDVRDKGRKRAFDRDDLRTASDIADDLVDEVRRSGLYPDVGPPDDEDQGLHRDARPLDDASTGLPTDHAGMRDLAVAARRLARLDGVAAVSVSAVTPRRAVALVMTGADELSIDHGPVLRHQEEALRTTGVQLPPLESWRVERLTVPGRPRAGDQVIATAVLDTGPQWAVVASVIVAAGDRSAAVALDTLHDTWVTGRRRTEERTHRRATLRRLLRPGEHPYTELVAHSEAVSRLAWAMARRMGFDEATADDAAVAGLLHDVGMRELDYDRLYRHPSPGTEERRVYRRHPEVGAALLDGLGSAAVVAAVRSHHERWDGGGYPDRLAGEAIPQLARIVHLAETWDVLTSPTSYRSLGSRADAETVVRREAGHQFDPRLVRVLLDVVG